MRTCHNVCAVVTIFEWWSCCCFLSSQFIGFELKSIRITQACTKRKVKPQANEWDVAHYATIMMILMMHVCICRIRSASIEEFICDTKRTRNQNHYHIWMSNKIARALRFESIAIHIIYMFSFQLGWVVVVVVQTYIWYFRLCYEFFEPRAHFCSVLLHGDSKFEQISHNTWLSMRKKKRQPEITTTTKK